MEMPRPETPTVDGRALRRFTRAEYDRMVELGVIGENEKIELIFGMLVAMSPIDPAHVESTRRITRTLDRQIDDRAVVVSQGPFAATDDSEPEPDCYVVPNDFSRWTEHPTRAFLIIEVARSSLRYDRGTKAFLYGISEVDEYWLVDQVHGAVEVHRDRHEGEWRSVTVHQRGDVIAMLAFPDVQISVADVLPPVASAD
jgi:Uma2 family endonuclease